MRHRMAGFFARRIRAGSNATGTHGSLLAMRRTEAGQSVRQLFDSAEPSVQRRSNPGRPPGLNREKESAAREKAKTGEAANQSASQKLK